MLNGMHDWDILRFKIKLGEKRFPNGIRFVEDDDNMIESVRTQWPKKKSP